MIIEQVRQTIKKYKMLNFGEKILIGLSGGPDSVALFHILWTLRKEYGLSFHLAHLNYRLRGRESDEDAEFVRRFVEEKGVPLTIELLNPHSFLKRRRTSLQEAARQVRYDFLFRIAGEVGAGKIALGQNADDQAETVLMRLLRGAGVEGLLGIPPIRRGEIKGREITIIRPLLETSREEIESYLKKEGLEFRMDSTNLKSLYLRNKIRLELLPLLVKEYNPNIKSILIRTAEILRGDCEYLAKVVAELKPQAIKQGDRGELYLDLKSFLHFPLAIQRRLLREAIGQIKGNLKGISFQHMEEILTALSHSPGNFQIHLPQNLLIKRSYDQLIFSLGRPPGSTLLLYHLQVPGIMEIPELNIKVKISILKREIFFDPVSFSHKFRACFDWAKVKMPLILRTRQPGDRFQPLGLSSLKKLKDFFIDEKIPGEERERTPLLVSQGNIVWVVGWRIDERFKVSEETEMVLLVEIEREDYGK